MTEKDKEKSDSKTNIKMEEFTKYEKARILGSRALQIAMGAPFLVKINKKDLEDMRYDPLAIAKMEFEKGIIPITIRRPLPWQK